MAAQWGLAADDNRAESDVAALVDGQTITYQMLDQSITDDIYKAQKKIYDLRFSRLNNRLLIRFIKQDPYSQGISPQAFLNQFVIKDNSVSAKEVDRFIKKNKIPQEKINDDLKKEVHQYLVSEKERKAVSQWFKLQSKQHGVVIKMLEPQKPKIKISVGDSPIRGNKQAPITLVEFSDFQCPYCAKAEKTVNKLLKKYPKQLRLVYKNFPLSFHKQAFVAAEAGLCAKQQSVEKFWLMHDKMFANPKRLQKESLKKMAIGIGLNGVKFNQCLDSHKMQSIVQQEMQQAQTYGVNSTPVFFINGVRIVGNQPMESFKKIIQRELVNLKN
ncbi:MAG: DsbA family protein [Enterobacterales bacterium]|nr:DsbA family protein [Enterobacterales bacterium]